MCPCAGQVVNLERDLNALELLEGIPLVEFCCCQECISQ